MQNTSRSLQLVVRQLVFMLQTFMKSLIRAMFMNVEIF